MPLFTCDAQVEGSLKIWWSIKGQEALSDEASTVIGDATEYTRDSNKHEAKHKEDYMQILQDQVRTSSATAPHLQ